MHWNDKYKENNRIWGDNPSELAVVTVEYLQAIGWDDEYVSILDVGCGYGRDAAYFCQHLNGMVTGIDVSKEAIRMARATYPGIKAEFQRRSFMEINKAYDVVFVSNLYHILRGGERKMLRKAIAGILKPDGLLFLGALSTNDPQEYGKGTPVPGEPNSFEGKKYSHFFTQDELLQDFGFLTIKKLYEREYYEPRATSDPHHHISWILIGECYDRRR
jgi:SAM-dependent methyltransferase